MGYTEYWAEDGTYFVHKDLASRIVYDHFFNKYCFINSRTVKTERSMFLPDSHHYEVDVDRATAEAKREVDLFWHTRALRRFADDWKNCQSIQIRGSDLLGLREQLYAMQDMSKWYKAELKKKQQAAFSRTMQEIDRYVDGWETATEVAKFVRDVSVDAMLVSASVVSGGAAAALAAGGSVLKGVGKWEDTGSFTAGAITAGVSFIVVVIPDGDKIAHLGGTTARALFFTKASTNIVGGIGVGVLEGKSLEQATFESAMDVGLSTAAGALVGKVLPPSGMKELVGNGLKNVPVPVDVGVKMIGTSAVNTGVGAVNGRLTKQATQKLIDHLKLKKQFHRTSPKRRIPLGDTVLADWAVLGPDQSAVPRRFAA